MRTDFKRVQEFSKQWDKQNLEKWNVNMDTRRLQSSKDTQFINKMSIIQKHNSMAKQTSAINQVSKDIEQFEAKFIPSSYDDE